MNRPLAIGEAAHARRVAARWYAPLDFFVVRAPLLPVEAYRNLSREPRDTAADDAGEPDLQALLDASGEIRRALAVGSPSLHDAARSADPPASKRAKVDSKLLRYLVRMSTRPTPFGLFAGVALGRWHAHTNLELAAGPRRQRTRADMAWLMRLVFRLESVPQIRARLNLFANPAALIHAGRVLLAERVSRGEPGAPPGVSIRATGVVRRALRAARQPVPFETLATLLFETTPGASRERVVALIAELCTQTILLTDLRPPLTGDDPARYVLDRLRGIETAADAREQLEAILDASNAWDCAQEDDGERRYRALVASAAAVARFDRTPFQVDSAVTLSGNALSRQVGDEVARAAELLLRLSPGPRGPARLAQYRRRFVQRYGVHREVSLLHLLDPELGLGPPAQLAAPAPGVGGIDAMQLARRNQALLELASHALHDHRRLVELDPSMLARLQTHTSSADLPSSLDLYASVSAASKEALEAGRFQVIVGPTVGGLAAGRTLGRFADLLPGAREALQQAAAAEEAQAPDKLWAELVYQPRLLRSANVTIRPNVRKYEIAFGVSASRQPAHTIPIDELVIGVRNDRFTVRWPAAGRDVVITAGHMLTHLRAPLPCRLLAELSRDGCCQLAGFQWGPAASFPCLPRVQVDRIVLALAQWRLSALTAPAAAAQDPVAFRNALQQWRENWQVPRRVYLTEGDQRLLLDLASPRQADELRLALRRLGGNDMLILTEVYPGLDDAWVRDSSGRHFMTELVVPLVLEQGAPAAVSTPAAVAGTAAAATDPAAVAAAGIADGMTYAVSSRAARVLPAEVRERPPGSDWLFVKLYASRPLEDDLLAGPLRALVGQVVASGLAAGWFFVRYNDPERHLRLRFRGQPERLLKELLPLICTWAHGCMSEEICSRFVIDTYEREIERFGGIAAMAAAEALFAADSQAVVDLLQLQRHPSVGLDRIHLAVMTVDALLDGLGLDTEARFRWCRGRLSSRHAAGEEYRQYKPALRALLDDPARLLQEPDGAAIAGILERLRASGAEYRCRLGDIAARGDLARAPGELHESIVHLHLNRLVDTDRAAEGRVMGLLWRVREGLHRSSGRCDGVPVHTGYPARP